MSMRAAQYFKARANPAFSADPRNALKYRLEESLFNLSSAIRTLFANNEQGAWYDPSDFSSMFQDSAGTTPVTAVGQPVGLRLDKRKGLARGPNIIGNGDFSSSLSGWAVGANCSATRTADGQAEVSLSGHISVTAANWFTSTSPSASYTAGDVYYIEFDATYVSGTGSLQCGVGYAPAFTITPATNGGTKTRYKGYACGASSSGGGIVAFASTATAVWRIDNVEGYKVLGNHATQPTAASRAILKAESAGLGSELWNDAAVTFSGASSKVSQGVYRIYSPDGTGSYAQIVGALTANKWYEVVFTIDSVASGSVKLWLGGGAATAFNTPGLKRQIVFTTDTRAIIERGAGVTDIQISGVSFREVTAWKNYYLEYDGVDDFYVTNSIDFSGTDKMTVIAGVRKNSDAGSAVVVELSANSNTPGTYPGTFALFAPFGSQPNFSLQSVGTAISAAPVGGFPQPVTAVLSGQSDIANDICRTRVNGVSASASSDQGTGNFGNYPLYIGRRGGAALPLNGREYGLIIRGAASDASQIAAAEAFMNSRTGAY